MEIKYKKGPVSALLTVYNNVMSEFISFLRPITVDQYLTIVDDKTFDNDCRSIQTIVSHIINSGYGYAFYIGNSINVETARPAYKLMNKDEIEISLLDVIKFTRNVFADKKISYEEIDAKIVKTPWNDDLYSIESILEHAVVHILRHKIQIERFLKSIDKKQESYFGNK